MLEQVRSDDRPDRDQAALRERRQACDSDDEREPDRRTREIPARSEIGGLGVAEHEWGERRDHERCDEERRAGPPGDPKLVCRLA